MKRTKILIIILFIILIFLLVGISYYTLVDTQSTIPEKIEEESNVEQEKFMQRKVFIIKPANTKRTEKTILYFHGGSYMAEASEKHWEFLNKLANDAETTIIMPDYPLAPKHNYEDVFEMVVPLYQEIVKKVDVENLIMMGDSAGGGLSLALEEKIAEEGLLNMPSKTILISPWLDVRLENPEIEKYQAKDKELNKETLKLAGIAYSKGNTDNNYLVNPIDGDLSKLKNISILIGTNDILNPDVKLLKEKAEQQGVRR